MLFVIVGAWLGLCLLLYLVQGWLVYHPGRGLHATPESWGLAFEDVTFEAADGVRLHGWYVPAEDACGTVLFCHGNAGTIADRRETLLLLHGLDLHVLMFDYRGYGLSEGSPDEPGTYRDAEGAARWLEREKGVRAEDLLVMGRSLGGAVAIRLAHARPPRALVAESTFFSVPDLAAKRYPLFPVRLLARYRYESGALVGAIACPKLFVHSHDDDIIPYSQGRKLFDAAAEPKRFLEISGGHNGGFLTSPAYEDGLAAFLGEVLE